MMSESPPRARQEAATALMTLEKATRRGASVRQRS